MDDGFVSRRPPTAARPRLGAVSCLHRFGSAAVFPSTPAQGVSRNRLLTPRPFLPRLTSRLSAGSPVPKCH